MDRVAITTATGASLALEAPVPVLAHGKDAAVRSFADAQLRSELRSIVLDVLGVRDITDLGDEARTWAERVADTAASAVCDRSVGALLDSIDATMADVPPAVAARFSEAAMRYDAGLD